MERPKDSEFSKSTLPRENAQKVVLSKCKGCGLGSESGSLLQIQKSNLRAMYENFRHSLGVFPGTRSCSDYDCDPSDHLQESLGPPGPKSQKSLEKSLFGGLQKSSRKYPKKSKNTQKSPNLCIFVYFLTFSGIFGDFFADPQKDSFRDSCKWSLGL